MPTLWGWGAILAVIFTMVVALAFAATAWLAPNLPADGARLLIVEGWLDGPDLDQAVIAFRGGHYERIVTTGGPIDAWFGVSASPNYA